MCRNSGDQGRVHYSDVIIDTMASQIASLNTVYSTVYSGADQRKHQSSASLDFVRGIHRSLVSSPDKGPVTRKMFPFDDVIMYIYGTPAMKGWHLTESEWSSFHQRVPVSCLAKHIRRAGNINMDLHPKILIHIKRTEVVMTFPYKQRVLMHGHQGWNVRHGLCYIYNIYLYIWVVCSFCLFCCLFIIVTTQFVALYKPCKPKPKPSTYDPPDNHPLAEIQRPILRPEPKQQKCHQHANTDHFGK